MLGVIADDLTGALDAALMLYLEGTRAPVIVGTPAFERYAASSPTVILDVDSRGEQPSAAYRLVRGAARALLDAGYGHLYKKMSSTFQGHIGPEVDAAMDEAGAKLALVVPAFPSNGRTTRAGIHYLDGVPISKTGVGRHPTSPITDSYLPRVLQAQTRRAVSLIELPVVRGGVDRLRAEVDRLAAGAGMALVDAETDQDLETIAEVGRGLRVAAGGSALVAKLPAPDERGLGSPPRVPERTLDGCLILAGSVSPVTAGQVAWALDNGIEGIRLDATALLEAGGCGREVSRATAFVLERLRGGRDALVYTPSAPEEQARARERGRELGIGQMEAGLAIAGCLAEIAARVIAASGLNRLVLAGGDTSSTICQRLGLDSHEVLGEVQTGVPISLSTGRQPLVTVLKSGNFGTPDFFGAALRAVRAA